MTSTKNRYLKTKFKMMYPDGAERDLYRALRAVARALVKATKERMNDIKDTLHHDETDTERIIREINEAMERSGTIEAADTAIKRILSGVDGTVKANIAKAFKNCLAVDILQSDPPLLSKVTEEWTQNASKLTKSIVSTYTDKLGTIISNAVQRGSTYDNIKDDVLKLYGVTENRARFIARNEVSNLNGIITKARQEGAGIQAYEWSTSLDERVRPTHVENEGKLFFWNNDKPGDYNGVHVYPSPKFHPGMDFNCRCVAIPVIDMEKWNVANTMPMGQPKVNQGTALYSNYTVEKYIFYDKNEVSTIKEMVRNVDVQKVEGTDAYVVTLVNIDSKMQVVDSDMMVEAIKQLPNTLRKNIRKVKISDISTPDFYGDIQSAATTVYKDNSITFWRNNNFPDFAKEGYKKYFNYKFVLKHEAAHLLDKKLSFISYTKEWEDAVNKDVKMWAGKNDEFVERLSSCSDKNYIEDFAESVALYYTNPKEFALKLPNRTKFLQGVLDNE